MKNTNETHFVVNMDNKQTIGFIENSYLKYSDVFSGEENMGIVVRVRGGTNAYLLAAFLIFKSSCTIVPHF